MGLGESGHIAVLGSLVRGQALQTMTIENLLSPSLKPAFWLTAFYALSYLISQQVWSLKLKEVNYFPCILHYLHYTVQFLRQKFTNCTWRLH